MKKIILGLLACLSIIGCDGKPLVATKATSIVEYKSEHKDAVVKIALQDPKFFPMDLSSLPATMHEQVDAENKKAFLADLVEPLKCKKVMLDDAGNVVAFAVYFKTREQSIESMKKTFDQQNPTQKFTKEQLVAMYPTFKLTEAECGYYVLFESLAVSEDHRRKGYGRKLIKQTLEESQQKWPGIISLVTLNVNKNNLPAQKLYESEGFTRSKLQPLGVVGVIQYELNL